METENIYDELSTQDLLALQDLATPHLLRNWYIYDNEGNRMTISKAWLAIYKEYFTTRNMALEVSSSKYYFRQEDLDSYYPTNKDSMRFAPPFDAQPSQGRISINFINTTTGVKIYDYAKKLAELSKGIDMGLINAKMPMIMTANNQAQAASLKAVYDKVQAGETLVVWKDETDHFDEVIPRKDPWETWTNDYKSTYIVSELLENLQTILNSFYMEIGLPTILNDKKAHTLNAEADMQSAQSQARIACWVQTLNESFASIRRLFPVLKLEVEYHANEQEQNDTDGSGDVSSDSRRDSSKKSD